MALSQLGFALLLGPSLSLAQAQASYARPELSCALEQRSTDRYTKKRCFGAGYAPRHEAASKRLLETHEARTAAERRLPFGACILVRV